MEWYQILGIVVASILSLPMVCILLFVVGVTYYDLWTKERAWAIGIPVFLILLFGSIILATGGIK